MASTTASRPPALMPVSIRMGENTVDMSVPTNVALAEFAPNIVSQITQLSASSASQGYRITNSQGKVLDQSQTLINQGIQAGSVLILSKIGDSTQDLRYDDLVEAVGTAVENDQAPWNSDNSVDLSTHASALLVLTAAVLIFTGGRGSTMGLIVGLSGAVLASLACAVIARNSSRLAPLSLAHSIPKPARGRPDQEPGIALMTAAPARIGIEWARDRGARREELRAMTAQASEARTAPDNPTMSPMVLPRPPVKMRTAAVRTKSAEACVLRSTELSEFHGA